MVWGAIGWGFKSKLVFLQREHGKKGIDSWDYASQVLKTVVGPLLEAIEEEDTIFMEDEAKIHMGKAKEVRKRLNIKGFED